MLDVRYLGLVLGSLTLKHNLHFRTSGFEPRTSKQVTSPASGVADFRGVTGGVYKARERIHRSMLTCDY